MPQKRIYHDAPDCPECGRQMKSRGQLAESGRRRWTCAHVDCDFKSTTGTPAAEAAHDPGYNRDVVRANCERLRENSGDGVYVITGAQDCTEKVYSAWASLKALAEHRGAQLIVLPVRYRNRDQWSDYSHYRSTWAKGLEEHMIDERVLLGAGVEVRGDMRMLPTAINPIAGHQAVGGRRWQIFAHPQLAMQTIAAPANRIPKRMYTTGFITQKNYSQSRVGAKADFYHVTGGLIVEIRSKRAFIRQLNADHEGRIYDLEHVYSAKGAERHDGILSLTVGDEHVKWMRPGVKRATYTAPDSIVNTLRPKWIVRHDVLDGYAGSHHHEGDYVLGYRKHLKGDGDYRAELRQCVEHINSTTPEFATTAIVPSNHHDHLQRWLARADDKRDPLNAKLITELRHAQYQAVDRGDDPDPFRLYVEPRLECHVEFLDRNEPFVLGGVDHSQHGDVGVNGARGSASSMARTTFKMTIGHSHTPCVEKGVYQAGTSTGRLEYQRGLSSWMNTHVAQYPNGKRTILDVFGTQWRGA